ncbi:MAG: PEP-CTERM sorting domain-containing protein [Opitutaceae bacterium]|nr:PEP-CTERM sorting domain-containing protein [Opitutaceae bacterium]
MTDTIAFDNFRVTRGGSLGVSGEDLTAECALSSYAMASRNDFIRGFRIVRLTTVPEPGTYAAGMGVMMLVMGVWVRRGRRRRV